MKNPDNPKVSVCIPVFNGSAYIAEAIESVLAQTYNNFELLVCDNCSTDSTEEIVRSFKDQRIRFVRNTRNLGLVGNANRCLDLARGEYICILHHDDIMLPDNLARKVLLLDEHPGVGFVHSNIFLIDSDGNIVEENIWNKDSARDYIEDGSAVFYRFLEYLPLGSSIFIGAVLARRSCYERVGEFSPELPHCNDSEMWMRMMLFYDVACIADPLIKYRVHPVSASSTSSWGDFTSNHYIKEHYLAVSRIFENYGNIIPQAANVRQHVSKLFADRLIHLICLSLIQEDFFKGKALLKEAFKISPFIIKKAIFWKIILGLIGGSCGLKVYYRLKNLLTRKTS